MNTAYAAALEDNDSSQDSELKSVQGEIAGIYKIVDLPPYRMADYERMFFPNARTKGLNGAKTKYVKITLGEIGEVVRRINVLCEFLRKVYVSCHQYDDGSGAFDNRALNDAFSDFSKDRLKAIPTGEAEAGLMFKAIAASPTPPFNVVPSTRYNNGVDIIVRTDVMEDLKGSKVIGASLCASYASGDAASLITSGTPAASPAHMSTPLAYKVIEACRDIYTLLFGSADIKYVTSGYVPYTFQFSQRISEIIYERMGWRLPEFLCDVVTNDLVEQFVSIELVNNCKLNHSVRMLAQIQNNTVAFGDHAQAMMNAQEMFNTLANVPLARSLPLAVPNGAGSYNAITYLNITVTAGLRFSLEDDIARFVSQTPDGSPIALSQVFAWFRIWVQEYMGSIKKGSSHDEDSTLNTNTVRLARKRYSFQRIPRYMLSPMHMDEVTKRRVAMHLPTESSRGDEKGMYVRPNGTFAYAVSHEQRAELGTAKKFYDLSEELLRLIADNNIPYVYVYSIGASAKDFLDWENSADRAKKLLPEVDPDIINRVFKLRLEVYNNQGAILGVDWDTNVVVQSTFAPGICDVQSTLGGVKPSDLTIADFLGYTAEGSSHVKPAYCAFNMLIRGSSEGMIKYNAFSESSGSTVGDLHPRYSVSAMFAETTSGKPDTMTHVGNGIIDAYIWKAYVLNQAPRIKDLCREVLQELGLTGLDRSNPWHTSLLTLNFGLDINAVPLEASLRRPDKFLATMFSHAFEAHKPTAFSALYNDLRKAGQDTSQESLEDDPRAFSDFGPLRDIVRLKTSFSGLMFHKVLNAVNSGDTLEYANWTYTDKVLTQTDLETSEPYTYTAERPSSATMLNGGSLVVARFLTEFADNYGEISERAKAISETFELDETQDISEMTFPGMRENRSVLAHQAQVQSVLRKPIPPKFAIIHVAPGGGKTGIGTLDFSALKYDIEVTTGEGAGAIRPIIIAPNKLIREWANDIQYFLGDHWNVLAINADVCQVRQTPQWGYERIRQQIEESPNNTVLVTSNSFLSSNLQLLYVAGALVLTSPNIELIRLFNPNYIGIDESHRMKNVMTNIHGIVKSLTTRSSVEFVRLFTGTLMPDRVSDIEGQVALFDPNIFRRGEVQSVQIGDTVKVGGDVATGYTRLTAEESVLRLRRFCAYVRKNRREWAWMLPTPVMLVHQVDMVSSEGSVPDDEYRAQVQHSALYDAVVKRAEDELGEQGEGGNKPDSYEGDGDDVDDTSSGGEDDDDDEDDFGGVVDGLKNQVAIRSQLVRLDALSITPTDDELYDTFFSTDPTDKNYVPNRDKYVPNKLRKVAQLARDHLKPHKWTRSGTIVTSLANGIGERPLREYDVVEHNGTWYSVKKFSADDGGIDHKPLPTEAYQYAPDDPKVEKYWRVEPFGKVIIVCRFKNSSVAIYNALPKDLQARTLIFSGSVDERQAKINVERFRSDPKIDILIASDERITEGLNLQIASCLIRVEMPWNHGRVIQTNARVIRPDIKAVFEGRMMREVVWVHTVVISNTIDIPKLARIAVKELSVVNMEEHANPLYTRVLNDSIDLNEKTVPITLSLEMLSTRARLHGKNEKPQDEVSAKLTRCIDAQVRCTQINADDMQAVKITKRGMSITKLKPNQAQVPDAKYGVYMPKVDYQPFYDPKDWKITPLPLVLESDALSNMTPDELTQALVGREAMFDCGSGRIKSIRTVTNAAGKVIAVTSVNLVLAKKRSDLPNVLNIKGPRVYLLDVKAVSPQDYKEYFEIDTAKYKDEEPAVDYSEWEAQEEQRKKAEEIRRRQELREAAIQTREKTDYDKRLENAEKGKPVEQGIEATPQPKPDRILSINLKDLKKKDAIVYLAGTGWYVLGISGNHVMLGSGHERTSYLLKDLEYDEDGDIVSKDDDVVVPAVTLHPALYADHAVIEAQGDVATLSNTFKSFGEFIYYPIANKLDMKNIYVWLFEQYPKQSEEINDLFAEIRNAFPAGPADPTKLYSWEAAPTSTLPSFLSVKKRMVTGGKLKIYPMFLENEIHICIDLATCPAGRKLKNTVVGAKSWVISPKTVFAFGATKDELRTIVDSVVESGHDVHNYDEAMAEIGRLRIKTKRK